MPCTDYDYVKSIQDTKKRLAEIEAMETLATQNNTEIHWLAGCAYVSFNTGVEDPETGEKMTIGKMMKGITLESLKSFIADCKLENLKSFIADYKQETMNKF